jgi:anti-sigma factor RsiW
MTNTCRILTEIATAPQGNTGPHLTNEQLFAYADGSLPQDQLGACEQHLNHCAECCEIIERLAEAASHADEPLPFPVFVPELSAVLDRNTKSNRVEAANSSHLALAAAENALPELHPINHLLPGFTGDATGDGCAPSQSSVLRLACTATESPRPQTVPQSIIAVWPTGQTPPIPVVYRTGRWRVDVTLPLPWPETHALLESGGIRIVTL